MTTASTGRALVKMKLDDMRVSDLCCIGVSKESHPGRWQLNSLWLNDEVRWNKTCRDLGDRAKGRAFEAFEKDPWTLPSQSVSLTREVSRRPVYHGNMAESQLWPWRSSHPAPYFKVRKQRLIGQTWFSLSHMVLDGHGKFRGGVGVMRRWGYFKEA